MAAISNKQNALDNITRAISKAVMLGEKPCINSLNNCPQGLTLEQVREEIKKGDIFHIQAWSKTEAEIKSEISEILNGQR